MVLNTIGPMPSGCLHRHQEAEAVAGEAAEMAAVIVLHELGAAGKQIGDLRDLQGDDEGRSP